MILTNEQIKNIILALETKDIPVIFKPLKGGTAGLYDIKDKTVTIDKTKGDWTLSLLHEATHALTIPDSIDTVEDILWYEFIAYFTKAYFIEFSWETDDFKEYIWGIYASTKKHVEELNNQSIEELFEGIRFLFHNRLDEVDMHITRVFHMLKLTPNNPFPLWDINKGFELPELTEDEQEIIRARRLAKRERDRIWAANNKAKDNMKFNITKGDDQ